MQNSQAYFFSCILKLDSPTKHITSWERSHYGICWVKRHGSDYFIDITVKIRNNISIDIFDEIRSNILPDLTLHHGQ